jgi:perosamine synthetase
MLKFRVNDCYQLSDHRKGSFSDEQRDTNNGQRPFIPYGRQQIDEDDIQAVVDVLRSDWLTTGPKVAEFEQAVADFVGAKEAVAVSSGTAALHAAMYAIGVGPSDEVILPPMTFVATANAVVFQGGTPVFADVEPGTLLIDPNEVEAKITPKTKAIIAVDYAGQPCNYDPLRRIAERHSLILVADACHALGAEYKGRKVGSLTDLTVFSFHPVKHITTGEGGMITTNNTELAERMRLFRNHGITRNPEMFTVHRLPLTDAQRTSPPRLSESDPPAIARHERADGGQATENGQRKMVNGQWYYEMQALGYNYRITDIQCALGLSQLKKLPKFLKRRREIAVLYDEALADIPGIEPLGLSADVLPAKHFAKRQALSAKRNIPSSHLHVYPVKPEGHSTGALRSMPFNHAYHLYVVRADFNVIGIDRTELFQALRAKGIGLNVHYIPVNLHPYYREKFKTGSGLCPVAEKAYKQILSLPIFPAMTDEDVEKVIASITEITQSDTLKLILP